MNYTLKVFASFLFSYLFIVDRETCLYSFIFFILRQNTAAETKLTITTADQHSSPLPVKQIKTIYHVVLQITVNTFQVRHPRCVQ
jgi:hypothetical protein